MTCTQTVVYTIILQEKDIVPKHSKNWELGVRVKLPPTMLHAKHKVKRGLTTVADIHFNSSQRELCVQV